MQESFGGLPQLQIELMIAHWKYVSFLPHGISFLFHGVNPRDEEMGVGIGIWSGDRKIRDMGEEVIEIREVIGDQNVYGIEN